MASESCDELLLKYLEGAPITDQEILAAFKSGIAAGEIFPVLAGSALAGIGGIGTIPVPYFVLNCSTTVSKQEFSLSNLLTKIMRGKWVSSA